MLDRILQLMNKTYMTDWSRMATRETWDLAYGIGLCESETYDIGLCESDQDWMNLTSLTE